MSPSGPEWLKHMACSVSVQSGKLRGRRANVCVENECILSVCVCVCPAHCPSPEVISPFSSTPAQLAADKQTMANDLSPRHLNVTAQPATVPPQVHIPAFAEWLGGS